MMAAIPKPVAPGANPQGDVAARSGRPQCAASVRRRIALLLTDLNGGGVQKTTLSLAGALAEQGHEVTVVLYSARGVLNAHLPPAVDLHHLKAALGWLPARPNPRRSAGPAPAPAAGDPAAQAAAGPEKPARAASPSPLPA